MRKKLIVFGLLIISLTSDVSTDLAQKSNELNQVRSDIDAAKQTMERLSQEKSTVQEMLAKTEERYGETAALLRSLTSQVEQKQYSVGKLQQTMTEHKRDLSKQNKELAGQVKTAFMVGREEKLKLLFNQQNPAVSSRVLAYYRYFNQARLDKIVATQATLEQLAQLDKDKQAESEVLIETQRQQQAEQTKLDGIKKERSDLLAQLDRDLSSHEEQLNRLKENEEKLRTLLSSLQTKEAALTTQINEPSETIKRISDPEHAAAFARLKGDFASLKGQLPLPVRGKLLQKFGSARGEDVWHGVLIEAKEGADVHAVSAGKVDFAGALNGYGLLIIINHGDGYMTLYAFNQSLYKKEGDTVTAGDVIASVGQSGGRNQSALYFEIRKKSTPIDPLEWCVTR